MDLTSSYLRAFFGAKSIRSSEMDSLAERMGVLPLMSPNPSDRYLITKTRNVTALSLGNKVVFGSSYYHRLTDEERLAVSAHELAHIMEKDNGRWKVAGVSLVTSSILMIAVLVAFHSLLLAESAFCVSFLGTARVLSSREAENGRLQELRCDNVAASFVGGEPMIRSIRLAESMHDQRSKRNLLRRFRRVGLSAVEERVSAINALNPK